LTNGNGNLTRYLPDVNVLIALSNPGHHGYRPAVQWLAGIGTGKILVCAVTESGFVRLTAAPQVGGRGMQTAIALLAELRHLPNCACLSIDGSWLDLIQPFVSRLQGYRQVTDALLLGLAIKNNAALVTFDRGFESLAGPQFKANLLTLV